MVLVFQHFPPFPAQMKSLENYNIRAIFTGHTHANRILRFGDILYVNTPPPGGAGLDKSPATIRVVRFVDDGIEIDSHTLGYGNQAEFAAQPAPVETGAPAIKLGRDWPAFKGDAARTGVSEDVVRPPLPTSRARAASTPSTLPLAPGDGWPRLGEAPPPPWL